MAVNLTKTEFHTPKTGGALNVCDGLPLYPGHGFRAGIAMDHLPFHLLDAAPQLLGWRFHLKVTGGFAFGLCGPAYATSVTADAEASADGSQLDVRLHDSTTVGGMVAGLLLTVNLDLTVEKYHVSSHWVSDGWHSHLEFEHHWQRLARTRFTIPIDVTAILVEKLLSWILKKLGISPGGMDQPLDTSILEPVPHASGLSSLNRTVAKLATDGKTSIEPTWSISIDLVQLAGDALTGPEFGEMVAVLNKFGIVLRFGPRFSFGLPVTVELSSLELGGGSYALDPESRWEDDQGLTHFTANRDDDSTVVGDDSRLWLRHSVRQEFTFDMYAHLQVLKAWKLAGAIPPVQLLEFLHLTSAQDSYAQPLASKIGNAAASMAAAGAAPEPEACGCTYNVVLDPVAA